MAGLSLCMIVKNESELIEKSILAVKPFVQEIVVVDTGSSDQTPILVKKLGAKLFKKSWNDDFSAMRNYSIQKATQPFILIMDADEVIIEGSMRGLETTLKEIKCKPGSAANITILNETMSGDIVTVSLPRIFPKDIRYQYKGKVHEQLTFMGKPVEHEVHSQIKVNHLGYTQSQLMKKNKYERNLALLMNELGEQSDISYIQFQIGRTYYVMKNYIQAEQFLNKSIQHEMKNSKRNFLSLALLTLGYCYIHLRKFDDFLIWYHSAIDLFPDYTDLYFMYGVGLIESRDISTFLKIPDVFRKCVELGEASRKKYETVQGVGSFKAHYNLALFYELTGQIEQAIYHYQVSSKAGYAQAKENLSRLLQ